MYSDPIEYILVRWDAFGHIWIFLDFSIFLDDFDDFVPFLALGVNYYAEIRVQGVISRANYSQ